MKLYRTQYSTEKSEAEGIARALAALIGGTSFFAMDSMDIASENLLSGYSLAPEDCVVLVRTSALADPIVKALKDHGIPYELSSESPWWTEEPVPEFLDFLRHQGTEPENNGHTKTANIIRYTWEKYSVQEKSGRKRRKTPELVEKLIELAAYFEDLPSLLDTLDSCAASRIPETQVMSGVRIMTIHASKGLEFEQVFVAGLEEGILPFTLFGRAGLENGDSRGEAERIGEERRLLYVAMTRARQGLWLSWAGSRIYRGRKLNGGPSRFLSELEEIIPLARENARPKRDGQLNLF